ncbi:MAG: rRNA maturation RNase YbeY [Muribaculaceae bacterium]|nr:rRNA maturation RNase YbeY [Muribaculaceae bacterium]
MKKIEWLSRGVELPSLDFDLANRWLESVALRHGKFISEISYIFCDDAEILMINNQFLSHDYYTDIITFDYSRGKIVAGDVFVSLDTVRSNAVLFGKSYDEELLRVIVHGLLHLCGINDKGPGEREIMEANENAALEMAHNFFK